ncbi:D-alanyl-D-alanine endopeptidase [Denitratisoma oestradiolicum]|uniref:Peptidase S11 n=1 Tax=Denitratisoma oestradiolicum TaxID=311182 RepID=A0A6S6XPX5_9PROT|nr:D-alanyl-D-alanine endopeptidase [Denitratisoma oestradiolicum]TWO79374.1 D-alanyl-D-alanine endopeptidase [Denitratisoma oestradiolicum]CAB1367986.1 Peptidase S11 [Denitratisoma oestradiolicum]
MKKAVISLVVIVGLIMGLAHSDAQAATQKKKTVAAKKHVRALAVKKGTRVHRAYSAVSPEDARNLVLDSASALVQDQTTGAVLFEKNAGAVLPIASITKLMTAMVALDVKPSLEETLSIGEDDVDILKGTHSRLRVGTQLSRENMLRLALMSSENRAASALSRHYPGGRPAFIAAMNRKAQSLGLTDTHFEDPTGLTAANVSSARDLTRMVAAAHQYPLIREFSTTAEYEVPLARRNEIFRNTNLLVRTGNWEIGLSKTGFISEAGRCLVMQAWLNNKPTIIVLLDSWGKLTRIGDANRIKRWIESASLNSRPTAG